MSRLIFAFSRRIIHLKLVFGKDLEKIPIFAKNAFFYE